MMVENHTDELDRRLLTYCEAADLLGVSDRTVWSLVDQGELIAVRIGRSVRVDPADLYAFIEKNKSRSGPEAQPHQTS